MPHSLPPTDPNSPASAVAPFQPALGVVANDVPGPHEEDVTVEYDEQGVPSVKGVKESKAVKAKYDDGEKH